MWLFLQILNSSANDLLRILGAGFNTHFCIDTLGIFNTKTLKSYHEIDKMDHIRLYVLSFKVPQ